VQQSNAWSRELESAAKEKVKERDIRRTFKILREVWLDIGIEKVNTWHNSKNAERGKRDVYCDKQVEKTVTVLNCVLKGLWGKVRSGGIRKKLKSEYTAYLESKFRRNDRGLI